MQINIQNFTIYNKKTIYLSSSVYMINQFILLGVTCSFSIIYVIQSSKLSSYKNKHQLQKKTSSSKTVCLTNIKQFNTTQLVNRKGCGICQQRLDSKVKRLQIEIEKLYLQKAGLLVQRKQEINESSKHNSHYMFIFFKEEHKSQLKCSTIVLYIQQTTINFKDFHTLNNTANRQ